MEDWQLKAVVDGVIRFRAEAMHPKAMELLWRDLTFPNPEYVNRVRFDRWVGSTPEEIILLETGDDGVISIPRGAVGLLRGAVAAAGGEVVFEDRRAAHPPVAFDLSFELRDYQREAADALRSRVQGCVVIPCGGGKTVVGVGVIAELGQPAVVLVHTKDLLDQWRETIRDALGLEAGIVAEGQVNSGAITVAMVQTLSAMSRARLAELGRGFGTVILDEAHHAPATVFRAVLAAFPGKYRFGLTATPERADGLTPLLELCLGPVVFNIDHARLVEGGHLVIPEVVTVETGCAPRADTHAAMVTALVHDEDRNGLVVDLAAREARFGKAVLVLSGRVDHCRNLADLLRQRGVSAEPLTGQVPKKMRAEILAQLRAGDLSVVCATTLADEGLDVSKLESLILATPARAEGPTTQRLGRLMRPHPGKGTPVLYDLVDDAPMAKRQHSARKRAYRKAGCSLVPG